MMQIVMHRGFSSYYTGPKSDHFNGREFFNPWNPYSHSWWDFIRWSIFSKPKPWPKQIVDQTFDTPPHQVNGSELRASFVGHSSVLLQTQGCNILTDPVWTEWSNPVPLTRTKRVRKPGIHFENLPKIDLVLISHNHYDHMDAEFLQTIGKRDAPLFLMPLGNDAILRNFDSSLNIEALDWDESKKLEKGITVHLEPSQHWSARYPWDVNKALWGAFVLETSGGNIYFAGDTGFGKGEHFKNTKEKFGSFRFAMLPIGAYEPKWLMHSAHMNPEEAFRAHELLGEPPTMAIHLETFRLSEEGYYAPAETLERVKKTRPGAEGRFRVLKAGEFWSLA